MPRPGSARREPVGATLVVALFVSRNAQPPRGMQRETAEFRGKTQNSAGIECSGAFTTGCEGRFVKNVQHRSRGARLAPPAVKQWSGRCPVYCRRARGCASCSRVLRRKPSRKGYPATQESGPTGLNRPAATVGASRDQTTHHRSQSAQCTAARRHARLDLGPMACSPDDWLPRRASMHEPPGPGAITGRTSGRRSAGAPRGAPGRPASRPASSPSPGRGAP